MLGGAEGCAALAGRLDSGAFDEGDPAGGILGVDAQRSLVHPRRKQPAHRGGDQRRRKAVAAPLPADADMVEPAALHSERLVLRPIDEAHDGARDLVAVPGDAPEARVEIGAGEPPLEVGVGPLARVPVIAEGLDVGVPDPPMIRRDDGQDLEAVGERDVRDRLGQVPEHHEPVADDRIAFALVQRDRSRLGLVRPAAQGSLAGAAVDEGDLPGTRLRPVQERSTQPPPTERRAHPTLDVMGGSQLSTPGVRLGRADDGPVDEGQEEVTTRVELAAVLVLGAEVLDGRDPVDPIGQVRFPDQRDEAVVIARRVERPERRAGEARRVGQADLPVEVCRHHRPSRPYFASMCLSTDLLIAFHLRRSSARASASTRRT